MTEQRFLTAPLSRRSVLASKLGRRFVVLFLGAALVPLVAFAAIAWQHVSAQLAMETERVLHNGAKTAGMGVAARLSQAVGDLQLVRATVASAPDARAALAEAGLEPFLAQRSTAVWRERAGQREWLFGTQPPHWGEANAAQRAHLATGKPLVQLLEGTAGAVMQLPPRSAGAAEFTYGTALRSSWLWDREELRIPGAEVAVFDANGRNLIGAHDGFSEPGPLLAAVARDPASGGFTWQPTGEAHLARYWRVFLRPQYGMDLLIVQSRAEREALAATRGFQRWFALTSVLALLAVLLISLAQMRRQLKPLLALREATSLVASGDYRRHVAAQTGDEIGELAAAFNHMTGEIAEQVQARERAQQDLVASRDAALAAARAKAEFVTNVSHELRTPMAQVLGAAEILASDDQHDDAVREEFSAMALHGARKLARLIDDVLELDGAAAWQLVPCELNASVQTALQRLPAAVQARVAFSPSAPIWVLGDRERLVDVWLRLLDNAAKFSAQEQPIGVRVQSDLQGTLVEVSDQGAGIAAQDLEAVFEPFLQVGRDQLTDKAQGTGLGLTIVRNTVQRLGGVVTARSGLGAGTTFSVRLPSLQDADDARSADHALQQLP